MLIYGEQKICHFNGKVFHLKPCMRDIRRQARKQAFS